jgi:hypothetical protein
MPRKLPLTTLLALATAGAAYATPAGKCRDTKNKKFAKCSAAGTEPVPTK